MVPHKINIKISLLSVDTNPECDNMNLKREGKRSTLKGGYKMTNATVKNFIKRNKNNPAFFISTNEALILTEVELFDKMPKDSKWNEINIPGKAFGYVCDGINVISYK